MLKRAALLVVLVPLLLTIKSQRTYAADDERAVCEAECEETYKPGEGCDSIGNSYGNDHLYWCQQDCGSKPSSSN
jgi:hypothetical protein